MKNYVLKKWYKNKNHQKFVYPDDMDEELIPMMDVFNNIPGIRTVFSCCGHGGDGWYVIFNTTSSFVNKELLDFFKENGNCEKLLPNLKFETVDFGNIHAGCNLVPETRIGVYCNELGSLPIEKRRSAYKKICEWFSKFTPRSTWDVVHEF